MPVIDGQESLDRSVDEAQELFPPVLVQFTEHIIQEQHRIFFPDGPDEFQFGQFQSQGRRPLLTLGSVGPERPAFMENFQVVPVRPQAVGDDDPGGFRFGMEQSV